MNRDSPTLFLTWPDTEDFLLDELKRVFKKVDFCKVSEGAVLGEGVSPEAGAAGCLAFVLQSLPQARPASAVSIGKWGALMADFMREDRPARAAPFKLHIFPHYGESLRGGWQRAELIRQAVQRALPKNLREKFLPADLPLKPSEELYQLCLLGPDRGYLSFLPAEAQRSYQGLMSPFRAGRIAVAPDKAAPSRAFMKLVEAQLLFQRSIRPGEQCVDLGAAPGGWSYVALRRGAKVVAVDRASLRADLMRHPALTFVKGDAFRFQPQAPVDWLLSDIIACPERSLELLESWLSQRLCRQFCVTVKFKGAADYELLEKIKSLLSNYSSDFYLRRLVHNKNEATAIGCIA